MNSNAWLIDLFWLSALWLIYFGLHSLLASLRVKTAIANRLPCAMPYYRLFFNIVAMVSLIPPLWMLYSGSSLPVWQWTPPWHWVANGIALCAVTGFLYSLRYYDGGEFLGLRQLSDGETAVEDQEQLKLSPLHRFVRHPWYFFALLMIWTRDMNSLMLVSASMLTIYFYAGSKLEENKLIVYYGDIYRDYMQDVPGIFPLPWRYLKQTRLDQLIARYHASSDNGAERSGES